MISANQARTLKQYEKPLRLWWEYYSNEGLCPLTDITATRVTNFLTMPQLKELSYSSLNIYRSAISLLSLNDLGKDQGLSRFFKGLSVKKPRAAKYGHIWDPEPVIEFIGKLYPNESLSLERLTKKLITLLAISTAQRVQTLSKIFIQNIKKANSTYQIEIPDRIKTTGLNRPQPLLNIERFTEQPQSCVAKTLEAYLERTSKIRGSTKNLFITIKKPHHEAKPETLSRWICDILKESGIDVSIFKAHSTRHASTSAAARNGVNLETIRKAAVWSEKSSIFARFYNRPLMGSESFSSAVIKKKNKERQKKLEDK